MTTGTPGNDLLFSTNVSFETIDGLAGIDTVSYQLATSQVTVLLSLLGTAQDTGGSGFDRLINIENLTGSNFNDRLGGNAGNNVLNGGRGIDTADYRHASGAVTLSLAITRSQNTGSAGFDRLISIENLIGSSFSDQLTGNRSNNVLVGDLGDDTFFGSSGNDTLSGDLGDDTADYSMFANTVTLEAFGRVIKGFIFERYTTLPAEGDQQVVSFDAQDLDSVISDNFVLDSVVSDPVVLNSIVVESDPLLFNEPIEGLADLTFRDFPLSPAFGFGIDTLVGIETVIASSLYGDTIDLSGAGKPATGTDTNLSKGVVTVNGTTAPLPLTINVRQFEHVIGSPNPDTITGDEANNNLSGGEGNDTFFGTTGNDTLDGGKGEDVSDYSSLGRVVSLGALGALNKGRGGIDTLVGIETVIASSLIGDTIDLSGAGRPATGTDTNLTRGVVTVYGTDAPLPLTVNVRQFEHVIGSPNADTITGDGANNTLNGGEGNDSIIGGDGADTLIGGAGGDTLFGSNGNDWFVYNSLSDSLRSNYDLISDYSLLDKIDRPGSGTTLNFSIGIAAGLSAAQIGALLNTPGVFRAGSSQAFTAVGFSGTFVAFNDGNDGYNEGSDSIIQLTSYVVSRRTPIQIV
ncbi:MAG: M10 family metallopeptidase C-terminal domain-containing protein [Cyanobacteriota bacterium]